MTRRYLFIFILISVNKPLRFGNRVISNDVWSSRILEQPFEIYKKNSKHQCILRVASLSTPFSSCARPHLALSILYQTFLRIIHHSYLKTPWPSGISFASYAGGPGFNSRSESSHCSKFFFLYFFFIHTVLTFSLNAVCILCAVFFCQLFFFVQWNEIAWKTTGQVQCIVRKAGSLNWHLSITFSYICEGT